MTPRIHPCALLGAITLLTGAARAQDLLPKAAPQSRPVLLTNGVIHTVAKGTILGGSLWFADGVLQEVLPADTAPKLPAGVEPLVIDLGGKHVFPGMVSAHTSLGLVEIGMVRQTDDTSEIGELTPEAQAMVAVNPDSTAIPVARSNGVLAAAAFPSGGLLPGRVAVLQLDGWTNAEMAVAADAGPVVAWPARRSAGGRPGRRGRGPGPGGPGGDDGDDATAKARERIDRAFADAAAWLAARTADDTVATDIRHVALAPALRGEVPVFVLAQDAEQIESAVLWATGRNLRPVIVGGREAAACATLLRERRVPVVLDGVHRLPARDDLPFDEPFTLPKRLAELGVRFCIATGSDFSNDRQLPYHAATAQAFGLDAQQALAAVTLDAAEILGVGKRLGSLEPGKDATLFIADGHPFELTTHIERAFIGGREIDLRNKQTELARKYRERYRQLRKS